MTAGLLGKCRAALLDLLFPPKCAFCGRLLEEPGDVCTTGSTLSAAAGALAEAGAAGVVCAVLAGGRRETGKKEAAAEDFGKN